MELLTEARAQLDLLCDLLAGVSHENLRERVILLDDAGVLAALESSTRLMRAVEGVRLIAAGVAAARSERPAGHEGLAQSRGHRGAVSLLQEITGASSAEAARSVRVGESLLRGADAHAIRDADDRPTPEFVWHSVVDDAVLTSQLTPAQHDAIRRGLGDPPIPKDATANADVKATERGAALRRAALEAWALAASELVAEAPRRTVEELSRTARTIRDRLDPEGAASRFLARYEARSFRMWTDADGQHRARLVFDDESALWVRTIIDAAMRPRRGGPRFVDAAEVERAASLTEDPRTNDQLAYDLMLDVLRAGTLADAESVFGTRQAGVRVVRMLARGAADDSSGAGHTEDGLSFLPEAAVEQRICETGTVSVTVDGNSRPLDVGREHRLFTARQRVALANRDGGCRWPQCDRPASYCEAHHTTAWSSGGRTDLDDGILLCRHHHMNLHHHGWWITRAPSAPGTLPPAGGSSRPDYVLHRPSGETFDLHPRLALRYAWGDVDPPPRRFRVAA